MSVTIPATATTCQLSTLAASKIPQAPTNLSETVQKLYNDWKLFRNVTHDRPGCPSAARAALSAYEESHDALKAMLSHYIEEADRILLLAQQTRAAYQNWHSADLDVTLHLESLSSEVEAQERMVSGKQSDLDQWKLLRSKNSDAPQGEADTMMKYFDESLANEQAKLNLIENRQRVWKERAHQLIDWNLNTLADIETSGLKCSELIKGSKAIRDEMAKPVTESGFSGFPAMFPDTGICNLMSDAGRSLLPRPNIHANRIQRNLSILPAHHCRDRKMSQPDIPLAGRCCGHSSPSPRSKPMRI